MNFLFSILIAVKRWSLVIVSKQAVCGNENLLQVHFEIGDLFSIGGNSSANSPQMSTVRKGMHVSSSCPA